MWHLRRIFLIIGCFSFCFVSFLKLKQTQFSQKKKKKQKKKPEKYFNRRQAFISFLTWLIGSEENVDLHNLVSMLENMLIFTNSNTVVLGDGVKLS